MAVLDPRSPSLEIAGSSPAMTVFSQAMAQSNLGMTQPSLAMALFCLAVEIGNVDVGSNVKVTYRFTDIYNLEYWTESLEF